MTASDLERRLAGLLHERAEGAMNATNTPEKLSDLLVEGHLDQRRGRRRWVAAGALVAAAAVAVAAWLASGDTTAEQQPAAPAPDAAAVATQFLEDLYHYDLSGVEAVLADRVVLQGSTDPEHWTDDFAWRRATGVSLAAHECQASTTSSAQTHVVCTFAVNALGSEQLGRGPFGDNTFDLTIRDGLITNAVETWAFETNGFARQMWEPFAAWVLKNHSSDVELMYTDAGQSGARTDQRSRSLWERRLAQYVAHVQD